MLRGMCPNDRGDGSNDNLGERYRCADKCHFIHGTWDIPDMTRRSRRRLGRVRKLAEERVQTICAHCRMLMRQCAVHYAQQRIEDSEGEYRYADDRCWPPHPLSKVLMRDWRDFLAGCSTHRQPRCSAATTTRLYHGAMGGMWPRAWPDHYAETWMAIIAYLHDASTSQN